LGWFGRKSQTDAAPSGRQTIRFDNDRKFLSIPALGYFGQYCRSGNDRYVLTWRDSTDDGSQGGARQSGPGRYLLLDDERIIVDGRLDRPNDGKVSDAGTFILNDWHFFSSELSGTFCAFRPDGAPIVRQRFEANLYNNGLSRDGRYACCQTCNSGSETDSSVLTIFDLSAEKEVSRFMPESGWAIRRDQLKSLDAFAGVLLHEIAHARSGCDDVTREFENELTELLGVAAAAAVSAPRKGERKRSFWQR
jgi:hypothetical protein